VRVAVLLHYLGTLGALAAARTAQHKDDLDIAGQRCWLGVLQVPRDPSTELILAVWDV
jgi:hypothetical protein